ncbi:MAG: hypothetical protein ACE5HV_03590 [Acidobacteriota bacterium]
MDRSRVAILALVALSCSASVEAIVPLYRGVPSQERDPVPRDEQAGLGREELALQEPGEVPQEPGAQPQDPTEQQGPGLEPGIPKKLVGPVVFHWFTAMRGQIFSAWLPLEGREGWDGSVEFWNRQDREIVEAGFNFIFFDIADDYRPQMYNHLNSLRQLREAGEQVPLVAPFIAPEAFRCFSCRKDFTRASGFGELRQILDNWFTIAGSVVGPEGLARVEDGCLLVGLWAIPGAEKAPADILGRLADSLRGDPGVDVYWSTHVVWEPAGPDEVNFLFNGLEPMRMGSGRNADLLVGFWNVEKKRDSRFLPRANGTTYEMAWESVLDNRDLIDRIYVESWNEYAEGSGLYPAVPTGHTVFDTHPRRLGLWCLVVPCHRIVRNDYWGKDPRLYMKISRKMSDRFLGRLEVLPIAESLAPGAPVSEAPIRQRHRARGH